MPIQTIPEPPADSVEVIPGQPGGFVKEWRVLQPATPEHGQVLEPILAIPPVEGVQEPGPEGRTWRTRYAWNIGNLGRRR